MRTREVWMLQPSPFQATPVATDTNTQERGDYDTTASLGVKHERLPAVLAAMIEHAFV